ncbi:hypothetical protein [Myxococcus sp. RHSTA-1-4]|uniref:hypothetical protein n=1 Tax=Myxococcus sp. RHSTA-1-4 TaxID=2874601 RepID=UPI001CBE0D71|nr:hypothetical protein [Myxococcus sp. RHSTA-1-4]MBZ4420356.1 hypothetical protein [Myxococcus sp. RHSTA-1-4]
MDWAIFFLEEADAAGPGEPRHRCMLTVGKRGASPHSVEAREHVPDAAIRLAVERAVAVLARKAEPERRSSAVACGGARRLRTPDRYPFERASGAAVG